VYEFGTGVAVAVTQEPPLHKYPKPFALLWMYGDGQLADAVHTIPVEPVVSAAALGEIDSEVIEQEFAATCFTGGSTSKPIINVAKTRKGFFKGGFLAAS
jgi:hypothetical protein